MVTGGRPGGRLCPPESYLEQSAENQTECGRRRDSWAGRRATRQGREADNVTGPDGGLDGGSPCAAHRRYLRSNLFSQETSAP